MPVIRSLRGGNRPGPNDIRIDRKSIWGNPYVMKKESERTEVILKHAKWLLQKIADGEFTLEQFQELGQAEALYCWCAPKTCHGEILSSIAEWSLSVKDKDAFKAGCALMAEKIGE